MDEEELQLASALTACSQDISYIIVAYQSMACVLAQ
jgi:hypothetical protein